MKSPTSLRFDKKIIVKRFSWSGKVSSFKAGSTFRPGSGICTIQLIRAPNYACSKERFLNRLLKKIGVTAAQQITISLLAVI